MLFRRADRRELRGADAAEASIGIERSPRAQMLGLGERLPNLRGRVGEIAGHDERPLLSVFLYARARSGARRVLLTTVHDLLLSTKASLHRLQMLLERIEVLRPKTPKRREPRVELLKRLRPQSIEATLRFDP